MGLIEDIQSAVSGAQSYVKQTVVTPVSGIIGGAGQAAGSIAGYVGNIASGQQYQQQQREQFSRQEQERQEREEQRITPPLRPPTQQAGIGEPIVRIGGEIAQRVPSVLSGIQAGMKPMTREQGLVGRTGTFLENVGTGVKNIAGAGARAYEETQKEVSAQIPTLATIQRAGFEIGQQHPGISQIARTAQLESAKAVRAIIPESVGKPMGQFAIGGYETAQQKPLETAGAFALGYAMPYAQAGLVSRIPGLAKAVPVFGVGNKVLKVIPMQAIGVGLGAVYGIDVQKRITAPVFTGYGEKRKIGEESTILPTGETQTTTRFQQDPMNRAPTIEEMSRRAGGIFTTELAPLSLGGLTAGERIKPSKVRAPESEFVSEESMVSRIFPQQVKVKVLTGTTVEKAGTSTMGTTSESIKPTFQEFKVPKRAIPEEYAPDIENLQGILRGENLPPRGTFPVAFQSAVAREEALTGAKVLAARMGYGKQTIGLTGIGGTFEKPTYEFASLLSPTPGKFETKFLGTTSPEGTIIPDIFYTEKTVTRVIPEAYGIRVEPKSPIESFRKAFKPTEAGAKMFEGMNRFWREALKPPTKEPEIPRGFSSEQIEAAENIGQASRGMSTATTITAKPKLKFPESKRVIKYKGYPVASVEEIPESRLLKLARATEREFKFGEIKTTGLRATQFATALMIGKETKQSPLLSFNVQSFQQQKERQGLGVITAPKTTYDQRTKQITKTIEKEIEKLIETEKTKNPPPPPYGGFDFITPPPKKPPTDTTIKVPPMFGGIGGLAGGKESLPNIFTGKKLRIHDIPSPEELMGFGNIKSKIKANTESPQQVVNRFYTKEKASKPTNQQSSKPQNNFLTLDFSGQNKVTKTKSKSKGKGKSKNSILELDI